jgi:DNA ligase D-like protein (predicted 3'-phosphoesterase)
MADPLKEYTRKRDLSKTPEPAPGRAKRKGDHPIFVVQQHAARRMHYDFRLEVDGVLKSWAVPKGPSLNPSVKRMAVPTEDHPMDYANFEGAIPPGNYGAGRVIVWDIGTYAPLGGTSMQDGLRKGHITFALYGEKLKGGFALTRFREGKDNAWLLVKMDDEYADRDSDITTARPESVLSGKTIDEIAA